MEALKKMLKPFLKIKPVHKLAFWANHHYLAYEHRKRYPKDLRWRPVPPSPIEKYDAAAAQIGHKLYVIGGYSNLHAVNSFMHVLDMKERRWSMQVDMPSNMAQSHLGVASDRKRYIYAVSGQLGPQCFPAIRESFVFDTIKQTWHSFPALPEPRYAPTAQLWRGRLHVLGGAMPDRYTPSTDHWSIAVQEGRAVEKEWRKEIAIPQGVMHFPSAILEDNLYIFGGQKGDYVAKPGCPCFECDGNTHEFYLTALFRLRSLEGKWEKLADMPIAASHTEFSVVADGTSLIVVGGQIFKDPETFQLRLTDAIQKYDAKKNQWSIAGHLPYRIKTSLTGYYDGWLYVTTGQRDRNARDPSPGRIDRRSWRAKI